jgi:hypothetical protein
MSFSKTVSVVAALASIFSVGVASWKMSEEIKTKQNNPLEEKIEQLEKQIEQTQESKVAPEPTEVPQPTVVEQQPPQPTVLPPVAPPPPPVITTETTQ